MSLAIISKQRLKRNEAKANAIRREADKKKSYISAIRDHIDDDETFEMLMDMPITNETSFHKFFTALKNSQFVDPSYYFRVAQSLLSEKKRISGQYEDDDGEMRSFMRYEENETAALLRTFDISSFLEYIVSMIVESDAEQLLHSVYYNPRYIEILLDNGVDVDYQDDHNQTILNLACSKSLVESVKVLLERGADQLIPDYLGRIPLFRITGSKPRHHISEIFFLLVDDLIQQAIQSDTDIPKFVYDAFSSVGSHKRTVVGILIDNCASFVEEDIRDVIDFILTIDPNLTLADNSLVYDNYFAIQAPWMNEVYELQKQGGYKYRISKYMTPEIKKKYLFTRLLIMSRNTHMYDYYESMGADINAVFYCYDDKHPGWKRMEYVTVLGFKQLQKAKYFIDKVDFKTLAYSFVSMLANNTYNGMVHELYDDEEKNTKLVDEFNQLYDMLYERLRKPKIENLMYLLGLDDEFEEYFYAKVSDLLVDLAKYREPFENVVFAIDTNKLHCVKFQKLTAQNYSTMLDHGLNPDIKIRRTPITVWLCGKMKLDCLKRFIDHGADINVESKFYNSEKMTVIQFLSRPMSLEEYSKHFEDNEYEKNMKTKEQLYMYAIKNNKCFKALGPNSFYFKYLCDPVTHELFEDPYIASDSLTYSLKTLEDIWKKGRKSPISGETLLEIHGSVGVQNTVLNTIVEEYKNGNIIFLR